MPDVQTSQEVIGYYASKIAKDIKLPSQFASLVPKIEEFFKNKAFWIVMEYCQLGDLSAYLKKLKKSLPKDLLVRFMLEASEALTFLHGHSPPVVHRDIKLNNFLVQDDGGRPVLKLCDFGVVKLLPNDANIPTFSMKTATGTPAFMAPEFFSGGFLQYGKSVDVFSLGLVFQVLINYDGNDDYLQPLSGIKKL